MKGSSRHEVTRKRVLFQLPSTEAVSVRQRLRYAASGQTMDAYYPPDSQTQTLLPAVIMVSGLSDIEQSDGEITPRNLKECEAESVALLCCAALDLAGVQEARGYIQNWWGAGNPIPERSAQRILKTADQILKAVPGPSIRAVQRGRGDRIGDLPSTFGANASYRPARATARCSTTPSSCMARTWATPTSTSTTTCRTS